MDKKIKNVIQYLNQNNILKGIEHTYKISKISDSKYKVAIFRGFIEIIYLIFNYNEMSQITIGNNNILPYKKLKAFYKAEALENLIKKV